MLWTVFLSVPIMVAIQLVSARIGRQSGKGLAANLREHVQRWFLYAIVSLLLIANTINIAADIGAMGEALQRWSAAATIFIRCCSASPPACWR